MPSLPSTKSKGTKDLREFSSPTTCQMSCVTCHSSQVTCQMSLVTHNLSHVTCHMQYFLFWPKWWSYFMDGLLSMWPTLSSFSCNIMLFSLKGCVLLVAMLWVWIWNIQCVNIGPKQSQNCDFILAIVRKNPLNSWSTTSNIDSK